MKVVAFDVPQERTFRLMLPRNHLMLGVMVDGGGNVLLHLAVFPQKSEMRLRWWNFTCVMTGRTVKGQFRSGNFIGSFVSPVSGRCFHLFGARES